MVMAEMSLFAFLLIPAVCAVQAQSERLDVNCLSNGVVGHHLSFVLLAVSYAQYTEKR